VISASEIHRYLELWVAECVLMLDFRTSRLSVMVTQSDCKTTLCMGGGAFFKVGGQVQLKNSRKVLWFELATVTSQALQYDVNKFCQHVSNFMQCFISTQRPPSIAYTTPYLSTLYATLTWALKCNQLFLVLQKIHSQGSRQMRHSQS